jgi:hypothetical protein
MKNRVRIEVPLSGMDADGNVDQDVLIVQPPCIYCGDPVNKEAQHYFTLEGEYKIKFWGLARDTHKPMLGDVFDIHGNFVKNKYILRIPYCPKHIGPVKTFTLIDMLTISIGMVLGLAAIAYLGAVDILNDYLFILSFLIPFFLAGLFYLIGYGIKAVLIRNHTKYRDYPLKPGHYGICAHGVHVEGGKPMEGPINYYLHLAFCNIETAKRFLKSIPQAEILQGKTEEG